MMMLLLTRRMVAIAAACVRVMMMGSPAAAGRCICVREAAGVVIIVRIRRRRGRSGGVSGQRTRRGHRGRRGGEGGHLSTGCSGLADSGAEARRARSGSCYLLCQAERGPLMEQSENPRDTFLRNPEKRSPKFSSFRADRILPILRAACCNVCLDCLLDGRDGRYLSLV